MSEATTLPAGRELNIRIGRDLMGLRFCDQPHDSAIPCSRYGEESHYSADGFGVDGGEMPRYSSDIAAAWQVIERFHSRADRWDLFKEMLRQALSAFDAEGVHECESAIAALAICRAALATMEDV